MIQAWVLTFFLLAGQSFEGGQYQTETQCERAARHQMQHWRKVYGRRLPYRCELTTL